MADGNPFIDTATIDEILLDVATIIELSPNDRRVAENRYRLLKTHLERPKSPLAPYLVDGQSQIYAQGSIATSTTIVSGTSDDRFDVDAIVEIDVPPDWSDNHALDLLEEALQGFPGVVEIVRCTRCVQLRFAFMHMDVAILDRRARIAVDRAGEIFHSPDKGPAFRVPSNPWGFTGWFRTQVSQHIGSDFAAMLNQRRAVISRNRLSMMDEERFVIAADAEQHALPPAIPSRLDAEAAVALKLLKRFLNLRYEAEPCKRPPSIYLTKIAGDLGNIGQGLSTQLFALSDLLARTMRSHLAAGTRPMEFNPSYRPDVINDRWPRQGAEGLVDMRLLADALDDLMAGLEKAAQADLAEIAKLVDKLFGERVGIRERQVLQDRYERRDNKTSLMAQPRTGAVFAPAILPSAQKLHPVPRHNFHPYNIVRDEED